MMQLGIQTLLFNAIFIGLLATGRSQEGEGQPADPTDPPLIRGETDLESTASPYLGLVADKIDENSDGIQVLSVRLRGPAYLAGIRPGDEIRSINERRIATLDDMAETLSDMPIGTRIEVGVMRSGRLETVPVQLGRRPTRADNGWLNARPILGIRVESFRDGLRRASEGVPRRGARVTEIEPGSPAAKAELPLGAVIVAANDQSIVSAGNLVDYIRRSQPGDKVELTYHVGDQVVRKSLRLAANIQPPIARVTPEDSIVSQRPSVPPNPFQSPEQESSATHAGPDIRLLKRTVDRLEQHVQALQDQLNETNQLLLDIKRQIEISDAKEP